MIYLASPYSHPDPAVRRQRLEAVCRAAARMLRDGQFVFSPIAHSVAIAEHGGAPDSWAFWRPVDLVMLGRCNELVVLKLDGWETSEGVQAEVARARLLGLPVSYLEPGDTAVRPTSWPA